MGRIREKIEQGRTLVMGLGKSGLAAVRFLLAQGGDVAVSEYGVRETISPGILKELADNEVFCEFGGHSPELFTAVDLIIVSPGVPLDLPVLRAAREAEVEIVGELALAPDYLQTPVVAVTGTNGKTTVTTMTAELLAAGKRKVFMGGNIGTPLAEYLLGPGDAEVAVLEVSSFQLDTAGDFRPEVGILLNITPDHLERYQSFEDYARSKLSIFAKQRAGDRMIVNGDDDNIVSRLGRADFAAERFCFGASLLNEAKGAVCRGNEVILSLAGGEERYPLPALLNRSPNRENCLAAVLGARLLGCPPQGVVAGLTGFRPLPHRLALVAEIDGVSYINDSKATNVGAVRTALGSLDRPVVLIAGGRGKGGGYEMLRRLVAERVKKMLLIGEARAEMAAAFAGLVAVEECESLASAVKRAAGVAARGDVVLLSPACASFDQFSSYVERGLVFEREIAELKRRHYRGILQPGKPESLNLIRR